MSEDTSQLGDRPPAANEGSFRFGDDVERLERLAQAATDDMLFDREALDFAVSQLPIMLRGAERGDIDAALDALTFMGIILASRVADPESGGKPPVPDCMRDYLTRAFDRIVGGMDPKKALNLVGRRRKWPRWWKISCAELVATHIAQGHTVMDATAMAAEILNAVPNAWPSRPRGDEVDKARIEPETLQTWYYELRDELGDPLSP